MAQRPARGHSPAEFGSKQVMREVHKFGGASVQDAAGVRNVGRLVGDIISRGVQPAVVVSAMAKSTNALEGVWSALPEGGDTEAMCSGVHRFHAAVMADLGLPSALLAEDWSAFLAAATARCGLPADDAGYDALVGFGERFSTRIVHAHLTAIGLRVQWLSAWDLVQTDAAHRAAKVDLAKTGNLIRAQVEKAGDQVSLMQGFVGGTPEGIPTTLGREGSDFSGALMAEALGAARLVVWKDVAGVMTGDPRRWPLAQTLERLDYGTAERMSAAGAGVLHPATMAPLQRAGIPLEVRSFVHPEATGTTISGGEPPAGLPPLWAFSKDKDGQELVRCLTLRAAGAAADWHSAFPDIPLLNVAPDPGIEGCFRLTVQHQTH